MMNNMFKKHLKEKRTNKNFQKMIDETDNKTLDSLLGMVIEKRLGDCQDDSNTKNISEEELSDKSFVGYFENMNHMYHMRNNNFIVFILSTYSINNALIKLYNIRRIYNSE